MQLFSFVFMAWWILPLVILPIAQGVRGRRIKAEREAQQAREQQGGSARSRRSDTEGSSYQEGPVINAEWVSVDGANRR